MELYTAYRRIQDYHIPNDRFRYKKKFVNMGLNGKLAGPCGYFVISDILLYATLLQRTFTVYRLTKYIFLLYVIMQIYIYRDTVVSIFYI